MLTSWDFGTIIEIQISLEKRKKVNQLGFLILGNLIWSLNSLSFNLNVALMFKKEFSICAPNIKFP